MTVDSLGDSVLDRSVSQQRRYSRSACQAVSVLNDGRAVGVHHDRQTSASPGPSLQVADPRFGITKDPNAFGKALLFVDDFKPLLSGIHGQRYTTLCHAAPMTSL